MMLVLMPFFDLGWLEGEEKRIGREEVGRKWERE